MLQALKAPQPLARRRHRQDPPRPRRGAVQRRSCKGVFDATRTADETASKPDPLMLLELMREFGVAPERTLMIGDTTHDLQLAANAGAASVGVSYGAHEHDGVRAHSRRCTSRTRPPSCTTGSTPRMPEPTPMPTDAARLPPQRLCGSAELAERGSAVVFDVLHYRPAGARVRAALRRPGRRLPEPLRARAHRDGLAAGRVSRQRARIHPVLDPRRRLRARATADASAGRAAAAG